MSGAMGARGVSRSYAISIFENSYASYAGQPPSQESIDAEARAWQSRLGNLMNVTEQWLESETRDKRIAPLAITIDTVPVEAPSRTQEAQALLRPALIALPRCVLDDRNLIVEVRVALRAVPSLAARTALSQSLCARIKAAEQAPPSPQPIEQVTAVSANLDSFALSLDGSFSVPKKLLPAVNQTRADFFKKATEVMVSTTRRFEATHPGVTLRRVSGVGSNAVRFFMDVSFGGFDLLTDVVAAKGAKRPGEVEVKDAFYYAWKDAGLPVQVELASLFSKAP